MHICIRIHLTSRNIYVIFIDIGLKYMRFLLEEALEQGKILPVFTVD